MTNPRVRPEQSAPRATGLWSWGGSSLPPDLLSQSCKRIGTVALVFASLWTLGFLMNEVVVRIVPSSFTMDLTLWRMPGRFIAGIGLVLSAAMIFAAAKLHHRPNVLLNIGLGFQVATALLIAIMNQWEPQIVPFKVSWICVIILVYPSIVPNTPGKTLFASLLAASMDPLAFGLAAARGVEITSPFPGAIQTFPVIWAFLPNYLCALFAVVPVHIIRGLGRQVSKARELGSYKLGEELGKGGMGEVYRAEHRLLARPAAIKLIRPQLLGASGSGEARVVLERFRREAEAAALLRSPHTIELYDFGIADDGTFYYVMELLDGLGFDALVERFGPVPVERAAALMIQACDSLAEAHSRGLMHRDIKPSNLFATRMGLTLDFVKVLDFGLVKADPRSGRQETLLTAPHIATGTPAFMAPEVAQGEDDVDRRIDVYSLGAVMYWLITGQLVFEASNPLKMMHRHIQDQPEPPSKRTELEVPPELDQLILACMAKNPEDRPTDAADLGQQLASIPLRDSWTRAHAAGWWTTHLPESTAVDGPCDRGAIMPAITTE